MTREDLLELIEEVRAGNEEAWKELTAAYTGDLARFVREYVPAHCPRLLEATDLGEFARDVVQEVWELLLLRLRRPPEEGGFDASRIVYADSFKKWLKDYFVIPRIWDLGRDHGRAVPVELPDGEEPSPEEALLRACKLREDLVACGLLLRVTFLCGGYPHQQLAFAFSKLIYGRESPRGVEGNPGKVDAEHGDTPLGPLGDEFLAAYAATSQWGEETLRGCLAPLRERLPLSLGEIMALDRASTARYAPLLHAVAADTRLRDYYASSRRAHVSAIPDWSYKVEKRVRQVLGITEGGGTVEPPRERRACGRCKLRHLPPCAREARCAGEDPSGGSRPARKRRGTSRETRRGGI